MAMSPSTNIQTSIEARDLIIKVDSTELNEEQRQHLSLNHSVETGVDMYKYFKKKGWLILLKNAIFNDEIDTKYNKNITSSEEYAKAMKEIENRNLKKPAANKERDAIEDLLKNLSTYNQLAELYVSKELADTLGLPTIDEAIEIPLSVEKLEQEEELPVKSLAS